MTGKIALLFGLMIAASAGGLYYYRGYYNRHLTFERGIYPAYDVVYKEGAGLTPFNDVAEVRKWTKENGIKCLLEIVIYTQYSTDRNLIRSNRGCVIPQKIPVPPPYAYARMDAKEYIIGTLKAVRPKKAQYMYDEVTQYLADHKDSIQKNAGLIVIVDRRNPLWAQPVQRMLIPFADLTKK